jgi:hypothetical protein
MWTLARALAVLAPDPSALRVEVTFRKPLFLPAHPADVVLHWTAERGSTTFEVRSAAGEATYVRSTLGAD